MPFLYSFCTASNFIEINFFRKLEQNWKPVAYWLRCQRRFYWLCYLRSIANLAFLLASLLEVLCKPCVFTGLASKGLLTILHFYWLRCQRSSANPAFLLATLLLVCKPCCSKESVLLVVVLVLIVVETDTITDLMLKDFKQLLRMFLRN